MCASERASLFTWNILVPQVCPCVRELLLLLLQSTTDVNKELTQRHTHGQTVQYSSGTSLVHCYLLATAMHYFTSNIYGTCLLLFWQHFCVHLFHLKMSLQLIGDCTLDTCDAYYVRIARGVQIDTTVSRPNSLWPTKWAGSTKDEQL